MARILPLGALAEAADYAPQIRISLEHTREFGQYLFASNAFRATHIVKLLNRKNAGVVLIFGHALMAKENSESNCFSYEGKTNFFLIFIPYSMAPEKALELCVRNVLDLCRVLKRTDEEALSAARESTDAASVYEVVRRAFSSTSFERVRIGRFLQIIIKREG